MKIEKRIMETLIELTAVPGISGTKSENLTANKIYEIFQTIDYFKSHPENLKLHKISNDPLERCFVSAILCGRPDSKKTVILTGHFDVVGIDEFGHLKPYAFDPYALREKISELSLDESTKRDLASNDYLFGRGTADMKYGIALEIELIRDFSENLDFSGNIMFLGVPGEESNSEGMLGAASYLAELQQEQGFEYSGLLLSECCLPKEADDTTKRIYLGTCGKIMPMFFFAGKESHVCEPFNGINPNLLASEVTRLLDSNSDFCDSYEGETTPTPLCLKQYDLKELYSVQTPLYAASYFNMLTLKSSPDVLLKNLKALCTTAFDNVLHRRSFHQNAYEKLSGTKSDFVVNPEIITYEELYNSVKQIYGNELDVHIENKITQWQAEGKDIQTISINIIKEVYERYPDKKPMIVIAFAPPYYPHKYQDRSFSSFTAFDDIITDMIAYAKDTYDVEIAKDHFFMGICDLSYTGISDSEDMEAAAASMPAPSSLYNLPVEALKKLDIPGVVFGGFAKDFHKYTERIQISYSFDIVPELYRFMIYKLLEKQADEGSDNCR